MITKIFTEKERELLLVILKTSLHTNTTSNILAQQ